MSNQGPQNVPSTQQTAGSAQPEIQVNPHEQQQLQQQQSTSPQHLEDNGERIPSVIFDQNLTMPVKTEPMKKTTGQPEQQQQELEHQQQSSGDQLTIKNDEARIPTPAYSGKSLATVRKEPKKRANVLSKQQPRVTSPTVARKDAILRGMYLEPPSTLQQLQQVQQTKEATSQQRQQQQPGVQSAPRTPSPFTADFGNNTTSQTPNETHLSTEQQQQQQQQQPPQPQKSIIVQSTTKGSVMVIPFKRQGSQAGLGPKQQAAAGETQATIIRLQRQRGSVSTTTGPVYNLRGGQRTQIRLLHPNVATSFSSDPSTSQQQQRSEFVNSGEDNIPAVVNETLPHQQQQQQLRSSSQMGNSQQYQAVDGTAYLIARGVIRPIQRQQQPQLQVVQQQQRQIRPQRPQVHQVRPVQQPQGQQLQIQQQQLQQLQVQQQYQLQQRQQQQQQQQIQQPQQQQPQVQLIGYPVIMTTVPRPNQQNGANNSEFILNKFYFLMYITILKGQFLFIVG
jgi:hypothetical protein